MVSGLHLLAGLKLQKRRVEKRCPPIYSRAYKHPPGSKLI